MTRGPSGQSRSIRAPWRSFLRAASRRSIPLEQVPELVSSLSGVETGEHGNYDGALVRWLDAHIPHTGAREADLLRLLAGRAPAEPRLVAWEGTRYRADASYAEAVRISRLLGEDARPYISSAGELVALADALNATELPVDGVRRFASQLSAMGQAVGWDVPGDWTGDAADRYATVSRALAAAARAGEPAPLDGSHVRCSRSQTTCSRAACSS